MGVVVARVTREREALPRDPGNNTPIAPAVNT